MDPILPRGWVEYDQRIGFVMLCIYNVIQSQIKLVHKVLCIKCIHVPKTQLTL